MSEVISTPTTGARSGQTQLFTALQDLKRQHPAHYGGKSIATVLFRLAWVRLIEREPLKQVADQIATTAVAQILLPGCDGEFWRNTPINQHDAVELMQASVSESVGNAVTQQRLAALHAACVQLVKDYYEPWGINSLSLITALPEGLELLCRQPRAGATRPQVQRLVLSPAELHGEHCLLTAVYAYLLADEYGAEPSMAFLAGLAHHFQNALLPDCGFAGEMLLGKHLDGIISAGREQVLQQLHTALADQTRAALRHHETISAPEGQAISAGDVLDRVLDVKWRTRAAAVTDQDILGDLDLVHDGPLKTFQLELLKRHQLWSLE